MTSDVPLMTASVKKQVVASIHYIEKDAMKENGESLFLMPYQYFHLMPGQTLCKTYIHINVHIQTRFLIQVYVCNIQLIVFILLNLLHIPVSNNSTCIMCSYYLLNMLFSCNSAMLVYLLYFWEHIKSYQLKFLVWCEQHRIKWISFQLTTQSECMFQKHYSVIPYFFPQNTNS